MCMIQRVILPALCALVVCSHLSAAAPTTAKACAEEAAREDSVTDAIAFLTKTISTLTVPAEKRSATAFLGSVQEQAGLYTDALHSYAAAAAIAAPDAAGMPKKSAEQLVLDAIRCALSCGDTQTADSYLNSAVRSSKNETVLAYVKLYEQWSALSKATSSAETAEPVALLKTYSELASMKAVQPQMLLTLWHVTGEKKYADSLKAAFPKSPETAIVQGSIQQLPAPFWYFVPRTGNAEPELLQAVDGATVQAAGKMEPAATAAGKAVVATGKAAATTAANAKAIKLQIGFFGEENHAKDCIARLAKKGFTAYVQTEVRPSGKTYYQVLVDENAAGTRAQELRTAGFDCYPVF